MEREASTHHSAPTQVIHWLTAVLVLVAFIYGPGGSEKRVYSAARDFDRQLHETLGLCVLALVAVRLVWRAFDTRPVQPVVPRWMKLSAVAVEVALYVLMFAVPLTAIGGAWLEGHPLTLLGGAAVPPWLAESHALGAQVAKVHTTLGDVILWIAGAHAAAALFHHYVLKDRFLQSMLPRGLRLPGGG